MMAALPKHILEKWFRQGCHEQVKDNKIKMFGVTSQCGFVFF